MDATRLSVAALLLSLGAAVLVLLVVVRPEPPPPTTTDASVVIALDALSDDVTSLSTQVDRLASAMPGPVDLSGLDRRISDLSSQVDSIRQGVSTACRRIADLSTASPSGVPAASPPLPDPGC
jgi:hypothetical protein